jgi:signal transduction histidine kinase
VPLVAGDKVIGMCSLDKGEPGFFTAQHLRLAEALVGQAAVVVQNAWLFEQVRAASERLQTLSQRLVEIQETERRYIARELHDEVGQALTSLMLRLRLLEREADQPAHVRAAVDEMKRMTDAVSENLHRLAVNLRPASLDHLGLVPALQQHLDMVHDQHGIDAQLETVNLNLRLPPDAETAIYRIVQEALTNVVRHSQATHVDVLLEQRGAELVVIIEDNGIGFDPAEAMESGRIGLFGMRERAEMLGGRLLLETSPRTGTTVLLEVPYGDSNSDRG